MATATKKPAVGDPVFFEGFPHAITGVTADKVEFASLLTHTGPKTNADGSQTTVTVPRFRTLMNLADLQWDDDLGAWYVFGRVLCKGRGGVGEDQRKIVADLRDRGLIPARSTRPRGMVPAGGEHLNLHKALFASKKGVNWRQEIDNIRRGEGLTMKAKECAAHYHELFKAPLADGYAYPGANDSPAGEV